MKVSYLSYQNEPFGREITFLCTVLNMHVRTVGILFEHFIFLVSLDLTISFI